MILEHDIPAGSRLYFADDAKLKRNIETLASDILSQNDFQEIVIPNFSYFQYQNYNNDDKIIRINNEQNGHLALKKDSTLDAIRLISHRITKKTDTKKWYYIQPEFSYPSSEQYKIGAEFIDSDDLSYMINTMISFLKKYDKPYILQISNINIIHLICKKYNIDIEEIKNKNYEFLFGKNIPEINALCNISTIDDLDDLTLFDDEIKKELSLIKQTISGINYEHTVIEVFLYPEMTYYSSMFFRFFHKNNLISNGGIYKYLNKTSSGFAIYIDNLIDMITKDT